MFMNLPPPCPKYVKLDPVQSRVKASISSKKLRQIYKLRMFAGNRYRYGCPQTVAWWLEPWTSTLAGVSLGFCLMDVLVIFITVRLRGLITKAKQWFNYYPIWNFIWWFYTSTKLCYSSFIIYINNKTKSLKSQDKLS